MSEVDRSFAGLLENSRRKENDAPNDEARLGRVSSFLCKSIQMELGSRTTPGWSDTADNLSIASTGLVSRALDEIGKLIITLGSKDLVALWGLL